MTRVAARWAMEPMKPQARSTTHRRTAQLHQQRRLAWLSGGNTPLSRAGSPRGVSGAYALPCGVLSSHRLEAACRWVWAGPSHRRYPLRIHESSSLTERAALARRVPRCARSCARPVVFSDACRDYSYTPTHIPRLSARLDRRPQASGPPSTPAIGRTDPHRLMCNVLQNLELVGA